LVDLHIEIPMKVGVVEIAEPSSLPLSRLFHSTVQFK